jgi:hypothetical protein
MLHKVQMAGQRREHPVGNCFTRNKFSRTKKSSNSFSNKKRTDGWTASRAPCQKVLFLVRVEGATHYQAALNFYGACCPWLKECAPRPVQVRQHGWLQLEVVHPCWSQEPSRMDIQWMCIRGWPLWPPCLRVADEHDVDWPLRRKQGGQTALRHHCHSGRPLASHSRRRPTPWRGLSCQGYRQTDRQQRQGGRRPAQRPRRARPRDGQSRRTAMAEALSTATGRRCDTGPGSGAQLTATRTDRQQFRWPAWVGGSS